MKSKLLAMVAMSGLLTASCMYIAPAMADDSSPSAGQSMPAPSDNGMSQNTNSSGASQSDSNPAGSDEGSPDTATGDDDY